MMNRRYVIIAPIRLAEMLSEMHRINSEIKSVNPAVAKGLFIDLVHLLDDDFIWNDYSIALKILKDIKVVKLYKKSI